VRTVNVTLGERPNGHAALPALLLPSSVVPQRRGRPPALGRWQRVFFVISTARAAAG
jgi:thiamine phosphate synthase YjbQ (UPF0047 family)